MSIQIYSYHDHGTCKHQEVRLRKEFRELQQQIDALTKENERLEHALMLLEYIVPEEVRIAREKAEKEALAPSPDAGECKCPKIPGKIFWVENPNDPRCEKCGGKLYDLTAPDAGKKGK